MLNIEIIYAPSPEEYGRYTLTVPPGCTVREALQLCPILTDYPEIQLEIDNTESHTIGVWSKKVNLSDKLKTGDRVEIYRPLALSAMDARRIRDKHSKKQSQGHK